MDAPYREAHGKPEMKRAMQTRVVALLLAVLTLAAVFVAVLNFQAGRHFQSPTDGVMWMEAPGLTPALEAVRVPGDSAGERAGIRKGDLLFTVNQQPTVRIAALVREQFRTRAYGSASYGISRHGIRFEVPVILDLADTSVNTGMRLIALAYLGIGLYVLFRRWTAPHSTHFYIFCLLSFVMYSFWYTGQLGAFDWLVYWGKIVAGALQPALFLHFALSFRERAPRRKALLLSFVYSPALLVVALQVWAIVRWQATELLSHRLDQIAMTYLDAFYILATALFTLEYARSSRGAAGVLRRQQLKWLMRGSVLSVTPFSLLYVFPFLMDRGTPDLVRDLAILSLLVLPLTFSWAIVRYRLMDVDLIFKRGVTYTLATGALLGLYFLVVAVSADTVHTRLPRAGEYGLIAAIIVTSILFDPVKRAIQNRVDRVFDRKRYDYRDALIDFGRELGTETDLTKLIASTTTRLSQTLLVPRVAVFLAPEDSPRGFRLAGSHGLQGPVPLALDFLDFRDRTHIFFENPHGAIHLRETEQRTASALDLHYYLPCRVQDRVIAVLGLGRTADGDFLSSEDVELLESLASYFGIAIQNATLYASLQSKIAEYERLKEFNENIVESTNVGIFAMDLEDRIESWNAQMEVLFARPRVMVLGQKLSEVFDEGFLREFDRVKNDPGVHHLYKFPLHALGDGAPREEARITNISIAPLVSREFQTLGRIVLVDDITARVGLESQLAQAEKLSSIGLLAAGVAHEVNTPLAVISSYTQMLSKQLRDDQRLAPLLDRITKQTFRASEIVNGLLNFSRTGSAEFRETDLNATIRETLALVEHQMKSSSVEVVMELAPDLPAIQGNSGKLQQVFLNLFLNARDAMKDGGTLRVATTLGACVTVSVADTGSGIAPEHVQRIYDPFFTTKTAVKEGERRGTGLGLAVTYGIMQEHSGKIRVESQPGAGTTFALEFPLKEKLAHA